MPLKLSFLSARIGLLFGLVTALAFGAMGTYLYRSHDLQMQRHDDQDLVEKIGLLRRQLMGFRALEAIRAPADGLPVLVVGHEGIAVALKDKDGRVLAETEPGAADVPAAKATSADRAPDVDSIEETRGTDGVSRRSIAAWGRLAPPAAEPVLLVVSRDDSMRAALLHAYGKDLAKAVVVSAVAAALLGYAVARRGLRPVREVARAARDISGSRLGARLQIEDAPAELADLVNAFNGMLDRLEDSFRRLSQFSSDMAHDLRTPIANLLVQTQVTLGQPRTAHEYEALLASNIEEYERLTRMMENMLFLARADNAQVALQRQQISAEDELRRVAEYFEGPAAEAGVRLQVTAQGTLNADPVLFRRAVSNLVSNALRYTPRGERIAIKGRPDGERAFTVEVSNRGPTIAPEHLPRIFDRFYRVDESRCESHMSSGLGLAIVRSIVTLHGGLVRAESDPEKGSTTFFLAFPGTPSEAAPAGPAQAAMA